MATKNIKKTAAAAPKKTAAKKPNATTLAAMKEAENAKRLQGDRMSQNTKDIHETAREAHEKHEKLSDLPKGKTAASFQRKARGTQALTRKAPKPAPKLVMTRIKLKDREPKEEDKPVLDIPAFKDLKDEPAGLAPAPAPKKRAPRKAAVKKAAPALNLSPDAKSRLQLVSDRGVTKPGLAPEIKSHPEVNDLMAPQTTMTNAAVRRPSGLLPVTDMDQNFIAKNPYIQYAIACMRPNVVNSTAYSLALIRGARIKYTASDRDREVNLSEDVLEGIAKDIEDMVAPDGCIVSTEIGGDANGKGVSMRLVVFEKDFSKFRYILLYNSGFYSIYHTVRDKGYDLIMKRIRTVEEAELPTITRLDVSAKGVVTSVFKLSGKEVLLDQLYPQVEMGVNKLVREFFDAHASTMVFMGEYGSGKSSGFRSIATMYRENRDFYMIDDTKFYEHSEMFTEVIALIRESNNKGRQAVIFLEECDAYVKKKEISNPFLSRFLSISDGTTGMDVKFLIAANLQSERDFDPALLRDGRTFALVGFRRWTPAEAVAARECLGMEPREFTSDVTLAQALGNPRILTGKASVGAGLKNNGAGFGI